VLLCAVVCWWHRGGCGCRRQIKIPRNERRELREKVRERKFYENERCECETVLGQGAKN